MQGQYKRRKFGKKDALKRASTRSWAKWQVGEGARSMRVVT